MKLKLLIPLLALSFGSAWAASGPYHAVVAQDGSGDYLTVSEALAAAPEGRTQPWLILVKKGVYDELPVIPAEKPNIHLIGQGRDNTIITHRINQGKEAQEGSRFDKTTYWATSKNNPASPNYQKGPAMTMILGPGFYAEGIDFVNSWGTEASSGPQALALHSNADRVAFSDCAFRSFQDTWRTPSNDGDRNYARGCIIEGAVDYMYDGGEVFVEDSEFYNVRGGSVIVAPSHGPGTRYGYVLKDCVVNGNAESADGRTKLGRPWHNSPRTVWINTTFLIPIAEEGWTDMGAIPAIFAEYGTHDRQGNPVDLSGRKNTYRARGDGREGSCPNTLTADEAAAYTYEAVIRPSEGWDPRSISAKLPAPTNLNYADGVMTWNAVDGASGYLVYDGDDIVAVVSEPRAELPTVKTSLKVRAVNRYGAKGLLGT